VTAPDLLDTPAAGPTAIRGGFLRIGAYIVGTVAAVGSFALLTRHLGVETVGRYSVATALLIIVGAFSDLGMSSIGVRELATRTGDDREAFARNLLGLRLVMTGVGGVAIVAFAAVAGYGTTLTEGVALGSVGLLLQAWQSTLAVSLMSELRLGWVASFELLRSVLNAAIIVLLVLAGARLLPFLAVTIPVGAAVLALNAWVVRGRAPLTPLFNAAQWRRLFAAAVPYAVAAAAAAIYFQLALIIVSLLANKDAVGYFGVSSRVIQVLIAIPGLAVGAAFPIFARAARDDRERLAYALGRVFEVSLLLGVLISVLVGVGAPLAIRVVGGAGFERAARLLAIQGVGLGASFVAAVWSFGLLSLGRTKDIMVIHLTVLIVGGTGIAILVSADGAQGAAIGAAVGEVVLALLTAGALTRVDRRLSPPLRIVPAVAVAAGLATLTLIAGLPTLAACAVAGLVYLAVVFALRAVPRELWHVLPGSGSS
jgi:O-antigen/teichoic acid export membrane protein